MLKSITAFAGGLLIHVVESVTYRALSRDYVLALEA